MFSKFSILHGILLYLLYPWWQVVPMKPCALPVSLFACSQILHDNKGPKTVKAELNQTFRDNSDLFNLGQKSRCCCCCFVFVFLFFSKKLIKFCPKRTVIKVVTGDFFPGQTYVWQSQPSCSIL